MAVTQRIQPVTQDEWTDPVRELFTVMDGPDARHKGPSRDIMLYLARHPGLSHKFMELGKETLTQAKMSDRDRELLTLRVAWQSRSDYEWVSHVVYGLKVGLSEAEIEAVKIGAEADGWNERDRLLLEATDQIMRGYDMDDATWSALLAYYDQTEMMELVYVVGNYMLFAAVLKTFRIPSEAWMDEVVARYGSAQQRG